MLKQGIKNYFTSLKFIFTPLGTMFLGMMIGFSILIPAIISAISSLATNINELAQSFNLDFKVLGEYIWERVRTLDWNAPVEAVKTILSSEWINDVLMHSLETILGSDFATFESNIVMLISEFTSEIIVNVVVFFVFWIFGFIAGYAVTKFLVRRSIARRTLWKFILTGFVNAILTTIATLACLWLLVLWKYSIFISIVVIIFLVALYNLFEAYVLYGRKKARLKDIVNTKNVGLYILSTALIFVMSACLTAVAVAINAIMGLFIGLAVFTVSVIVVGMNAESYVINAVGVKELKNLVTQSETEINDKMSQ